MSTKNRFCVQFCGTQPQCNKKTKLLYSDSKADDIREIWKAIYSTDAPNEVNMIVGNHSVYSLNDDEDFEVFMAIAEDQYRLLPSKPLSVALAIPGDFNPSTPVSTPSPDRLPDTCQYEGKINGFSNKMGRNGPFVSIKHENGESIPNYTPRHNGYDKSPIVTHNEKRNGHSPQDLSVKNSEQKSMVVDFSQRNVHSDVQPITDTRSFYNKSHDLISCKPPIIPSSSAPEVSAAATFVNNIQQQRLLQNSPSASYILQTFLRNNFERAAAMQIANGMKPTNGKSDSILTSALNDFRSLHDGNLLASRGVDFNDIKKRKRKSYPKTTLHMDGLSRVMDTSKRMRSSPTQSNIEYHYERAVEYHTMTEEEQKSHNSAHRSHWKHLLFVSQKSPSFLSTFRTAKYDEWSSEARDIFAISKPDKYKWSFLTLSKQGDVLCRRIKKRILDLKDLKLEDRPDWCPPDEILEIAMTRADERLGQLERILYSRSITANQQTQDKLVSNENLKPTSFSSRALAAISNSFVLPPSLKPTDFPAILPTKLDTSPLFQSIKQEASLPNEAC